MTWQAYADLNGPTGEVSVTLGQFSPGQAVLANFETVTLTRVDVQEAVQTAAPNPLRLPADMAEALYKSLDRIFGNHHDQGALDATRAALAKEQARVDHVLTAFLPHAVVPPVESLARPAQVPGPGSADS